MFAIAFSLGMLWGAFGLATFLVAIRDIRARRAASSKFVRAVAGGVSTPVLKNVVSIERARGLRTKGVA